MKKTLLALAAALALAAVSGAMAAEPLKTKGCDTSKKHCGCPCMMTGVERQVSNTATGVVITITAKDPAVVKQLQEAAAACPAKCKGHVGCPKGCKCPKCAAASKAEPAGSGKQEEKKADK